MVRPGSPLNWDSNIPNQATTATTMIPTTATTIVQEAINTPNITNSGGSAQGQIRDTVLTHLDQPDFDGGQVLLPQVKVEPVFASQNGINRVPTNSETNFESPTITGLALQNTGMQQNTGMHGSTDPRTDRIDCERLSADHISCLKVTYPISPNIDQVKDIIPKKQGKRQISTQSRAEERPDQGLSHHIGTGEPEI